jgi:hypothetical protein
MKADWGWVRITSVDTHSPGARLGEMVVNVKYNLKHPSFWPVLWNMFDVRPAILKPLMFLWALQHMIRKCGA